MKIRKQLEDLTEKDLIKYPIWEYCLNEETIYSQNEHTMRPYLALPPLDLDQVYVIVRASFRFANDVVMKGFIRPIDRREDRIFKPLIPLDHFPVLLIKEDQICLSFGGVIPSKAELLKNYKLIGYPPEKIFPITCKIDIPLKNDNQDGVIEGFMYIEPNKSDFFDLSQADIKYII